jgi:hypothetical protein
MTALHMTIVPSRRSVAAVFLVIALLLATVSPAMATTAGQVGPTGGSRKPPSAQVVNNGPTGGSRKPPSAQLPSNSPNSGFASMVTRLFAGMRSLF